MGEDLIPTAPVRALWAEETEEALLLWFQSASPAPSFWDHVHVCVSGSEREGCPGRAGEAGLCGSMPNVSALGTPGSQFNKPRARFGKVRWGGCRALPA